MSAARHITLPPWARPNAPRAVARPSWIARPNARSLSLVPPPSSHEQRPIQSESPMRRASVAPRVGSIAPRAGSIAPPRLSLVPPLPDPRIEALESTIAGLAAELATLRGRVLEESEPELVRLALTIAERIVGREITVDPAIVASWTEEAIEALGSKHAVVVAVAPDLASVIEGGIVDASLLLGSCEVRDGSRTIEVSAHARSAAIADALEISE